MTILFNCAGLVGSAWLPGAIVQSAEGLVYFALRSARKVNGTSLAITWSQGSLPTAFRTRLDVSSTAEALSVADGSNGMVRAEAIGNYSAVAWKAKARRELGHDWTVADLVTRKAISQKQADALVAFYADEAVAA